MTAPCHAVDAGFRARRAEVWLGTLVDITTSARTERAALDNLRTAFATIAVVHRSLSGHSRSSELTRVNRNAARATQSISSDFRDVLECALELAAQSNGAFDPTIGGDLVALGLLPILAQHERGATWRDVDLDGNAVRFRRPLILDFDGIAKGYAVDRAITALRSGGATQSMVNAGGDLTLQAGGAVHAAEAVSVTGRASLRADSLAIDGGWTSQGDLAVRATQPTPLRIRSAKTRHLLKWHRHFCL